MSEENVVKPETTNNDNEQVTYTQDEVKKLIESESDKKLSKVLAKKEEEFNARINSMVEEKIQEDKRLSKLSEVERKEAEFEKREKALQQKELEIKRKQVRSDLVNELSSRKLDTRFSDFITHDDSEKALEQLNNLNELLNEYKETAIAEHFKANGREVGQGNTTTQTRRAPSIAEMAHKARKVN